MSSAVIAYLIALLSLIALILTQTQLLKPKRPEIAAFLVGEELESETTDPMTSANWSIRHNWKILVLNHA